MIKLNIIDSDNENYISDVQFAEIIILLGKSLDMSATCSINNKGIDITLKQNKNSNSPYP